MSDLPICIVVRGKPTAVVGGGGAANRTPATGWGAGYGVCARLSDDFIDLRQTAKFRHVARYPRPAEPYAGNPHVRFYAGAAQQ